VFRKGLNDTGYVAGRNLAIEYRFADNHYDRLPALMEDLVRRKVDVIVTAGGVVTANAAKAATAIIPIVFSVGGDPIRLGLISSLNRPGGNITCAKALKNARSKVSNVLRILFAQIADVGTVVCILADAFRKLA
jgi:putative ABC transport system substrate-binding protein